MFLRRLRTRMYHTFDQVIIGVVLFITSFTVIFFTLKYINNDAEDSIYEG